MRFKLIKSGKCYRDSLDEHSMPACKDGSCFRDKPVSDMGVDSTSEGFVSFPAIWSGAVEEYRSLLVLREAELTAARAQLTGNDYMDWYTKNVILRLETNVVALKEWFRLHDLDTSQK